MEEREVFQRLMKKQIPEGALRDLLKELRIKPTYGNGIAFQMVKRAAEGDLSAAKYVLGVVQEEAEAACGPDLSEVPTEQLRQMLEQG